MQIQNLKMVNFNSIEDVSIDFEKGMNLIIGRNGSGKSTVIDAIGIMLLNYSKLKRADYVQWDKKFFELEMVFTHLGKNFEIKYRYDNSAKINLKIDNEVWDDITSAYGELGKYFDPKMTLASVFSFEDENTLVSTKPAERRELLKRIMKCNFTETIQRLDKYIKSIKEIDLKKIDNEIYFLKNKEYKRKKTVDLPITARECEEKEKELEEVKKVIVLHESRKNEKINLEKRFESLKKDIDCDDRNISEKINKVKEIKEEIDECNLKITEGIDNEVKQLEIQLENWQSGETDEGRRLLELEDEKEKYKLVRILKFDETELKEKNEELFAKKNEMVNVKKEIDLIKQGKCPTCGKSFESDELEKKEKDLEAIERQIDLLTGIIKNINLKKKEHDDKIEENNKAKLKLEQIKGEIQTLDVKIATSISGLLKDIEAKKGSKKGLEKQVEVYKNNILDLEKDTNFLIDKREEKYKEKKKIEIELENFKIEDISSYEEKQISLNRSIEEYKHIKAQNDEAERHNKELEIERKKDEKNLTKKVKEKEELLIRVGHHEEAKIIFQKKFPNYLLNTNMKFLQTGMNTFISEVYEKPYEIVFEEKKDSIYVYYGKKKADVAKASGFERALFSLAYKDSLNKMQGLDFCFLDEADKTADENNSENVFRIIGDSLNRYNQVIVITHKKDKQELLGREYHAKVFEAAGNTILEV